MELTLKRINNAKLLLTIAENLVESDREESYQVLNIAEAILKRANQSFKLMSITPLPESDEDVPISEPISVDELERMFSDTAPPGPPGPGAKDSDSSTGTGTSRRNFTIWAKTINLQTGHSLYFGDIVFRFSFDKKGRASLTTQTRNAKTIIGYSPSGTIKAYLKSIGSTQKNVDGWKRLSMDLGSERKEIGWPDWLLREWDTQANVFRCLT